MSADPAASHEPLTPGRVIALDYGSGSNAFRAFHDSMADVCELSLTEGQEFRARSRTRRLGAAVLTDMQSCSLQYSRTTRHVARSGYDHFQVHLNLAGESHVRSGRRTAVFRTGDVGILDTVLPTEYTVLAPRGSAARSLSLFVPRAMLAPLLASSGYEHCAVLRSDSPVGKLLGAKMNYLATRSEAASASELDTAFRGLLSLLAGTIESLRLPHQLTIASIKRYVDTHLDSAELSAESLCSHSGWSRATLYRLFEADGGLASYIQERRLQRALWELVFGRQGRRVLDIALQNHFSSEATFNRAFRRTFGIPPGATRALAQPSKVRRGSNADPQMPDERNLTVHWIRQLVAPSPSG